MCPFLQVTTMRNDLFIDPCYQQEIRVRSKQIRFMLCKKQHMGQVFPANSPLNAERCSFLQQLGREMLHHGIRISRADTAGVGWSGPGICVSRLWVDPTTL